MKTTNLTVALVAAVAALAGFYGGFHFQSARAAPSTTTAASPAAATARGAGGLAGGGTGTGTAPGGAGGFGGGGGRGGGVGTVSNLTAAGFTLHTAAGTDVNVVLTPQATVRKTTDAARSELQNNLQVTVTGQRDASGNITATAVTIVPATPAAGG